MPVALHSARRSYRPGRPRLRVGSEPRSKGLTLQPRSKGLTLSTGVDGSAAATLATCGVGRQCDADGRAGVVGLALHVEAAADRARPLGDGVERPPAPLAGSIVLDHRLEGAV